MYDKMNDTNLKHLTPASLTILRFLSDDPMRDFYQREIARAAKVSVGATNQILRILAEKEIVTREKRGKMFFYKYNIQNPVARQLKILFNINDLDELIKKIRDQCKRIILFGSCAEGSDVKDSDVDLFILTNEKDPVKKAINHHEKRINKKISAILVNANEFVRLRSKDKPLHERIMKGIILWQAE